MRLLLCEDERELSAALVKILKHYHYSIDAVYDGQEALDYLDAENYDAVILDLMMPKVDGLTVLKTIREQGNQIPVLILSAKSTTDDKVTGLDYGANDYLIKPFETKELLARVRAMTRTVTDSTSYILTIGNLSLNQRTFELYTDTDTIKLASTEFQMMEMLIINKNHIISTQRFMDKIWGYDTDTELGVVWVYISYLRKKLVKLKADVKIKVIRNTGYTLEVVETC